MGTVPPKAAPLISCWSSRPLAVKQIGQTRYLPSAATYLAISSGSGGHPVQAVPRATASSASRTASLVKKTRVGRPDSAAATATSIATVTFSRSSSPVVKLITALPMSIPSRRHRSLWSGPIVGLDGGCDAESVSFPVAVPDPTSDVTRLRLRPNSWHRGLALSSAPVTLRFGASGPAGRVAHWWYAGRSAAGA